MMFKDDYKNEIDKIKPDKYIKDRVQKSIAAGEKFKPKYRKPLTLAAVTAAALCFAILASVGIFTNKTPVAIRQNNVIKTTQSYSAVYKTLSSFKPTLIDEIKSHLYGGMKNSNADGDYVVVEEGATADMNTSNDNASAYSTATNNEHSETNIQVEGVDEADVVKTDGKNIYMLYRNYNYNKYQAVIKIFDIKDKEPKPISSIEADSSFAPYSANMYLSGDRLVIVSSRYLGDLGLPETFAIIYDISDPANPKLIEQITQSGDYNESRLISGKLYLISNFFIDVNTMTEDRKESYIPSIECNGYNGVVGSDTISTYKNCESPAYTVVSGYDITDGKMISTQSVLGGSYTVYVSTKNIITTSHADAGKTAVVRFAINKGIIELKATGEIKGELLNQFSIDEYNDHFRFVLTDFSGMISENSLVILDGNLKETGKITDIAKGEKVYSVRFMGEIAYFVTFRQVDPLFSVDVSNPAAPKIIGSLKIPGFSDYLHPFGDKLLGIGRNADEITGRVQNMKLSIFDITDPTNVTESSKTDLNTSYSEALNNHKAIIVDYKKNIIGFPAYGNNGLNYFIYSYENGKFTEKLNTLITSSRYDYCRGLYVGNVFYIVANDCIRYIDLDSFELLGELKIN